MQQDDALDFLNDAYVDIAVRTEILVREMAGVTSGNTIAIPDGAGADPAAIRVLSLHLAGVPIEFTDDMTWHSHSQAGSSPSRTLGRVDEDGMTIVMYPTPSAGTAYVLKHSWFPSGTTVATRRLDDPTDTPKLPQHLHRKLIYYAQAMAWNGLGEDGKHDRAMALYERGLPEPRLGRALIAPGPDSLLVVPGPFDRVTSKHI